MSSSPSQREHIHNVFMNATFYVGVSKLMAKLECSKSAAVLYALNEGLFKEGVISKEDHDLLAKRYSRTLKQVLEQSQGKRENTHVPVLTLEQLKEKQLLELKDQQFRGVLQQWEAHPDLDWRRNKISDAKKYQEKLQSAKDVVALELRYNIAESSKEKISETQGLSSNGETHVSTEEKPRNLSPIICPKISEENDPNLAYLKLLAEAKPLTSELEQKDREFREALQQWGSRQDVFWRGKIISEAKQYQDKLQSAKKVTALEWRESAI